MINDIKFGMKIIKYGHGIKMTIVVCALYLLLGVLNIALMLSNNSNFIGGLMLLCIAVMPAQVFSSLNISHMALTSPLRKKMQTSIPSAITCVFMLVLYLINVMVYGILAYVSPYMRGDIIRFMIISIAFAALAVIYTAIAYKLMLVGSIMFTLSFFALFMMGAGTQDFSFLGNGFMPFVIISAAGVPVIIASGAIGYLITLVIYKKPMSKYSQNAFLRKEV